MSQISRTVSKSGLSARSRELKRCLETLEKRIVERQPRVMERDSRGGWIYVTFPRREALKAL